MRLSHFFIDRPIFATVLSLITILVGALCYFTLPVSLYPEVAPPTIQVAAFYPGASAETIAETVAAPIEQSINGVENMVSISSQSTDDGRLAISVIFKLGTDLDVAQVQVQNRVSSAEARLPEEVRRQGVTTTKNSSNLMMVIHVSSPDHSRDPLFISNYTTNYIMDRLTRLEGVGQAQAFGARTWSMRVWLDPGKMAAMGLSVEQVIGALQQQNVQVPAGTLGLPPHDEPTAFQVTVHTQGRLLEPEQFGAIVVKSDAGRLVRVRDIARVELGAQSYDLTSYLNQDQAQAIGIFQRPGSNALDTAAAVKQVMEDVEKDFPSGLEYSIIYNPTEYVAQSIDEVLKTMLEALVLVVVVVIVFLQTWRAAVIPVAAIPVSLIGTFAIMSGLGYSLNSLSLFGLVLAIGIVVDDAIVVVENVERKLADGMSPRDAARATMDEVGGALIAISLVLTAVFVPTAFISGITGQFFRQFAVTISVATIISTLVSLTLSPALCAILLKPHKHGHRPGGALFGWFFEGFNKGFDWLGNAYGGFTGRAVRRIFVGVLVYGGLIALTAWQFDRVPSGFIPQQDKGYLFVAVQLAPGASLERTDKVIREASAALKAIPGVANTVGFAGLSGATFTTASNAGVIFLPLLPYEQLKEMNTSTKDIYGQAWGVVGGFDDAFMLVLEPPPVDGMGNAGGFSMAIQDRTGKGPKALAEATTQMMIQANQVPGLTGVFTFFDASTPQLFLDIDRTKAEMLGVSIPSINQALSVALGSAYVNDFNISGRTYQVTAQADQQYRLTPADIGRIQVRNADGLNVPLGSLMTVRETAGPARVPRYNLYPSAELQGSILPGVSSGEAIDRMRELAGKTLPEGFGFEWTDLSLEQVSAGNTTAIVFALSVLLVFLVLAALYESWLLPLAIILIVPMCLLAAITGIQLRGMDNNILTQIGLVVLVGLASKNAILIVEFARHLEEQGRSRIEAAVEAARLRLRPILMTSLAFILGVVPLVIATGAGSELRRWLGTAVFSGMIGVTLFGLIFTPIFYVLTRAIAARFGRKTA